MSQDAILSPTDFGALMEVGKGFEHGHIPDGSAVRLIRLGLISSRFGSHQLTDEGKSRLSEGI